MTITRILYHPIVVLGLTIVAIVFFFSLDKSGRKTQNSSENIRILEYEVNHISQEVIALEEKILEAESEQFKEKVVRNELLLQKPGEYVLQIAENSQAKAETACDTQDCQVGVNQVKNTPLAAWRELLF